MLGPGMAALDMLPRASARILAALFFIFTSGIFFGAYHTRQATAQTFSYANDPDVSPLMSYFASQTSNNSPTVSVDFSSSGYIARTLSYSSSTKLIVVETPATDYTSADAAALGAVNGDTMYQYDPSSQNITSVYLEPETLDGQCDINDVDNTICCQVHPLMGALVDIISGACEAGRALGTAMCQLVNAVISQINREFNQHIPPFPCPSGACSAIAYLSSCTPEYVSCKRFLRLCVSCDFSCN